MVTRIANIRELKMKFVYMIAYFFDLILITSRSLIRQECLHNAELQYKDSEVSRCLYKDPKWDSIRSVS